jgi:RHS repeat-associated protein
LYDPWGKRLETTGINFGEYSDSPGQANALRNVNQIDRGYTMHEHLDELGFIHMNGRIFDPITARFAQADPFIPEVTKLQAFNRYSYVYNNPLRYTDPTGYRPFWEQTANKQAIRAVGSISAATVIAIYAPQLLAELAPEYFAISSGGGITSAHLVAGGTANAVATGVIAGSVAGYISSGGDGATALKQGIVGGLFGFVGGTGASNGWSAAGAEGQIKYISSHALVGCVSGAMDGSGCGRGAASAAFGKLVTLNTQGNLGVQVAGTVLAGGVAAKIGGGKFATGAALAGFGYLFNQVVSDLGDARRSSGPIPGLFDGAARDIFNVASWTIDQVSESVVQMRVRGAITAAEASELVAAVHANALNADNGTWVYELVKNDGTIYKFGITSRADPQSRYPQWFYAVTGTTMVPLSLEPNRAYARGKEYMLCKNFQAATGRIPIGSIVCYAMGGIAKKRGYE